MLKYCGRLKTTPKLYGRYWSILMTRDELAHELFIHLPLSEVMADRIAKFVMELIEKEKNNGTHT